MNCEKAYLFLNEFFERVEIVNKFSDVVSLWMIIMTNVNRLNWTILQRCHVLAKRISIIVSVLYSLNLFLGSLTKFWFNSSILSSPVYKRIVRTKVGVEILKD